MITNKAISFSGIITNIIAMLFGLYIADNSTLQLELIKLILTMIIISEILITIIKLIKEKQIVKKIDIAEIIFGLVISILIIANIIDIHNLYLLLFSTWITFTSVKNFILAFQAKKKKHQSWIIYTVVGVLKVFLGLLLFINPFSGIIVFNKILGLFVIFNSLLNIINESINIQKINKKI